MDQPSRHSAVEVIAWAVILSGWAGLGGVPTVWEAISPHNARFAAIAGGVMVAAGGLIAFLGRARFSGTRFGIWWGLAAGIAVGVVTYNTGVAGLATLDAAGRAGGYAVLVGWSVFRALVAGMAVTLLAQAWRIARLSVPVPMAAVAMLIGVAVGSFISFTLGKALSPLL